MHITKKYATCSPKPLKEVQFTTVLKQFVKDNSFSKLQGAEILVGNEDKQYPCCCGDMGCPVVSRGVAAAMAVCGTAGQLGRGAWRMSYVLEMLHWNAGHCLMMVLFCFSQERSCWGNSAFMRPLWEPARSSSGAQKLQWQCLLRRGDIGTGLNSPLAHSSSFHGEALEKPLPICAPKRPVIHLTWDTIPRNSLGEGKGIETSFASSHEGHNPSKVHARSCSAQPLWSCGLLL